MFEDRKQAGKLLAQRLKTLSWLDCAGPEKCAVIALPRGGVPVALEIALSLGCPLDVLVSKKMQAPDNPELAIGAVSSSGLIVIDEDLERFGVDIKALKQAQDRQKQPLVDQTRRLEEKWTRAAGLKNRVDVRGKNIILVDDGVATGMTTLAALRSLRQLQAGKIILAVPVIPYDTYLRLQGECDFLIALCIPYDFHAVASFYLDFHQVEDDELLQALKQADRGRQDSETL